MFRLFVGWIFVLLLIYALMESLPESTRVQKLALILVFLAVPVLIVVRDLRVTTRSQQQQLIDTEVSRQFREYFADSGAQMSAGLCWLWWGLIDGTIPEPALISGWLDRNWGTNCDEPPSDFGVTPAGDGS